MQNLEVRQQVADLLAVVKRHAADDDVRDLGQAEFGLEGAGLLVGAAEDGEIASLALIIADAGGDFAHHGLGLLLLVLELQDPRRHARPAWRGGPWHGGDG